MGHQAQDERKKGGERALNEAEGDAQRVRATHGRKVSSNSGAINRRRKREKGGYESQGQEDEGKEERKRGTQASRRAMAASRKVENWETTRP